MMRFGWSSAWDSMVEDVSSKLRLFLAVFVVAVIPAALLEHFGTPSWLSMTYFALAFGGVATLWLAVGLHEETGPWHLQAHIQRIADEVRKERGSLPQAPVTEVVDLTAFSAHVLDSLGRAFARSPKPEGEKQPPPPAGPPPQFPLELR